METITCNCAWVGLPCECGPARGRSAHTPCPSEAAYRRELRHRAADPTAPVHDACRAAACRAHNDRIGRRARAAEAADLEASVGLMPCRCPRVVYLLEVTLLYAHGYAWAARSGLWIHE